MVSNAHDCAPADHVPLRAKHWTKWLAAWMILAAEVFRSKRFACLWKPVALHVAPAEDLNEASGNIVSNKGIYSKNSILIFCKPSFK